MSESFSIDPSILNYMRCPVTLTELSEAPEDLVDQANGLIKSSELTDRLGQSVPGPIDAAFINADQTLMIPVRGGIIVMLENRLIPLSQLEQDN